jgi:predicted ATPase
VAKKRAVHFHALLLEVHQRIEHERRAGRASRWPKVAADLAAEATCCASTSSRSTTSPMP